MSIKERVETRRMQNPGDLRVPEGVTIEPTKRVLILGESASLEGEYDEVSTLYKNGNKPTQEAEREELNVTTISREPLDKGLSSS